ncbi:MAG TPA: hypothetical protein ENJ87_12250, partial [Gammaproteobacteria bacterium]|nr:hypothetical protein [Gammaproteobacteria bacterium]
MITDQKTLLFTKIVLWLTLLALLVLVSTPLSAEPSADMRTSLSISFDEKSHPDKVTRDTLLSMADSDIMPALNKQGYRLESAIKTSLIIDNTTYQENDFR